MILQFIINYNVSVAEAGTAQELAKQRGRRYLLAGNGFEETYELAQTDQLTMTAGTYRHPDRGSPFDERSREYADQDLREQAEKEDR
jgi:hypothetical protein